MEDLWAFNDERVAKAIMTAKPVVSAVGHATTSPSRTLWRRRPRLRGGGTGLAHASNVMSCIHLFPYDGGIETPHAAPPCRLFFTPDTTAPGEGHANAGHRRPHDRGGGGKAGCCRRFGMRRETGR